MGSYAECWLGSFYVGSTKNDIDPKLMTLFRASDKIVLNEKKGRLPNQLSRWIKYVEEEENIDVVYYSAPVEVIRDRLNLTGYTLETAKRSFSRCLEGELREHEERCEGKYAELYLPTLRILRDMNLDKWLFTLKEIYEKGLEHRGNWGPKEKNATLVDYMLEEDWYGFPGPDLNVALRLAIEVLPESENCIYDLTDLVLSGYYDIEDDFLQMALDLSSAEYLSTAKIIILTEGSTDSWILCKSMQLLYPHLSDYFTFMDFDVGKVAGGAGNLANIVKVFSGAGIVNKVIALFDNDSAAKAAIRGLERASIPKNIKIVQLPNIALLDNYPTVGPSGEVSMNVNGMAGSIEPYLGEDVLKDDNGQFYCVQWTGYDSSIGKYQGEILGKESIQKKFAKKLESCKF